MSIPCLQSCNGSSFLTKAKFLTVAHETHVIWYPISSLNSSLTSVTLFQSHWLPWSSWVCQAESQFRAFYWLFPPPGLLFSQIRLTSSQLLQFLLKYPLVNEAYPDNHSYNCPLTSWSRPNILCLHLISFTFL